MLTTRKSVPDLMKGIAVVAMIQVHIMELFARQEILDGLAGEISLFVGGPFAAPVFMAVMGYFIAYSKKSISAKLKRGIGLMLLGLLLNIGLNLHLLIKIWNGTYDLDPFEYILGADILTLAGLSIIAIALFEKYFKKKFLPFFLLAVLLVTISPYLPDLPDNLRFLQAFFYGDYSWSYFPVFPWLAYPFTGYAFGSIEANKKEFWQILKPRNYQLVLISILIIIILVRPSFSIITDLQLYYHHSILLFTWMMGFLLVWAWFANILEKYFSNQIVMRYFKWLGKNVTVIYVIQWLIIGNIATAIFKTQSYWALMVWFLAITTLSSVLGYLYILLKPDKSR
jgi:uncharacterized membrane protein